MRQPRRVRVMHYLRRLHDRFAIVRHLSMIGFLISLGATVILLCLLAVLMWIVFVQL